MNNGYAIFLNDDGTETKLSWDELKLEENGKKYHYKADRITDKEIEKGAFEYLLSWSTIKEICIPKGVEHIGHGAFYRCNQLEKVILPSTLKKIEGSAFHETAIEEIDIPDGVERIEEGVFSQCKRLKKATLPSTLKEICGELFIGSGIREINIPEGVENVYYRAFERCEQLEKVTLPSTLKKIYGSAFRGSGIKKIVIPEGTEYIELAVFDKCNQLEEVFLPSTIKEIGPENFEIPKLKKVIVPNKEIKDQVPISLFYMRVIKKNNQSKLQTFLNEYKKQKEKEIERDKTPLFIFPNQNKLISIISYLLIERKEII